MRAGTSGEVERRGGLPFKLVSEGTVAFLAGIFGADSFAGRALAKAQSIRTAGDAPVFLIIDGEAYAIDATELKKIICDATGFNDRLAAIESPPAFLPRKRPPRPIPSTTCRRSEP